MSQRELATATDLGAATAALGCEVIREGATGNRRSPVKRAGERQSGMFPCLRGGRRSRFVSAVSSASISTGRVRRGSITSST